MSRFFHLLLTFLLIFSWLFASWPPVWFNPRFPPKIQEARAVAQGDGIVLYAKSTNDGVYQRTFTAPSTVTGETNILSGFTDTIRYIELKAAPTRNEMIAVVQAAISTTGSSIVVLRWNGSAWSVPFCIRTGGGTVGGTACTNATYISNANTVRRAIAIEYENTSGEAMVLYSSGAATTNEMKYQTWNGTSWSGELNLDTARLTGIVTWIELVPKPGADEMQSLFSDANGDLSAITWSGSAWTAASEHSAVLEAALEDIGAGTHPTVRSFDGAYESSSGDFIASWGFSSTADVRWATRPTGSNTWTLTTADTRFPEIATLVDMAGDPDATSNYVVHASQDPVAADNQCAVWSGTGWPATPVTCDQNAGAQVAGNQGFGVGFVKSGSTKRAIVVWPEAASVNLNYYYSDPTGNTWATAIFAIAGAASTITTPVEAVMDPFNTNILMATVQKGTGIHMLKLSIDATPTFTWTNPLGAALATSPTTGLYQPFSFAFHRFIPPITTLGNGAAEPSNVTVGPGAGATDLDNFTLVTSSGADTVSAATVILGPAGAFNNIAQVDITDTANTAKCTAVTGLSSNTVTFTTCNISVDTNTTTYKVRITPKTHGNMPAVPGASYDTTGTVTDITCTNTKSLNDTGSATVTADNASPGAVSGTSGTPGNQQVQLNWTNPGDSDYAGVVVLHRANTAVGDTPTEGNTYVVGNTIGSSTVGCVENSSATTCTDNSGLNNGTQYHYKIFTKDTRGNYDAGTVPTGSPFTPQLPVAISITTDGTVGFGYLGIGASANSSGDIQTVQVDSGPANLNIKSTNFTEGVNTWTLNTVNGDNQVKWEFSKDGSSWTTFEAPDPASCLFDTNVSQGQTRNLYLRITMPTGTSSYNQYGSTVTIVASAP